MYLEAVLIEVFSYTHISSIHLMSALKLYITAKYGAEVYKTTTKAERSEDENSETENLQINKQSIENRIN